MRKIKRRKIIKPYYETKLGKLYHGDCLEIMPHLEPVDLVFADPPYFVGFKYEKKDTEMKRIEPKILYNMSMKISPLFLITPGMKEYPYWSTFEPLWQFGWFKPGSSRQSRLRGFNTWEPVLIFGKISKPVWQDAIRLPDVTNHVKSKCEHPCPKPMALLMSLIEDFSSIGQCVLDPFLGSGTTAVACERLNRRWIGIEIEEKYCEIAAKRIEQEVKQRDQRQKRGEKIRRYLD